MARLIELSHPIAVSMPTYPGFPAPHIGAHLTHEQSRSHYDYQAEFHVSRYDFVGSLGTYLDSPFHRHRERADLSEIPLDRVANLPGIVVDARVRSGRALGAEVLRGLRIRGLAILFRTDWDSKWGSPAYWEPAPFLSVELCRELIERGSTVVGVDFWNVDDVEDLSRPAHTSLLGADIPIVENLANLAALPRSGFRLHAAPLAIVGGASAPLRAYAVA